MWTCPGGKWADAFAVACLPEGIELRKSGIKGPILILGWTPVECADQLLENGLIQSILDEEYANELNEAAKAAGRVVEVHIKLDTGMSRTGIYAQEDQGGAVADTICRIARLSHLHISGIFTHFAAADMIEKDEFTNWQLNNYKKVIKELEQRGFRQSVVHHTGNSACTMYHPETYFDMVRAGVMLYGFYPRGVPEANGPLKSVLALKSRVAQVKELPVGGICQLWMYL